MNLHIIIPQSLQSTLGFTLGIVHFAFTNYNDTYLTL